MELISIKNKFRNRLENARQKLFNAILPALCAVGLAAIPSLAESPISTSASDLTPLTTVQPEVKSTQKIDTRFKFQGISAREKAYNDQLKKFDLKRTEAIPLTQNQTLGDAQGGVQSITTGREVNTFRGFVPDARGLTSRLFTSTESNNVNTVTTKRSLVNHQNRSFNESFLNFSVQAAVTTQYKGKPIIKPIFTTPGTYFVINTDGTITRSKEEPRQSITEMTQEQLVLAMSKSISGNHLRLNVGGVTKTTFGTLEPAGSQIKIENNLAITNSETKTLTGTDPSNPNLFTSYSQSRATTVYTPNQNPLDENLKDNKTLNNLSSAIANIAGLFPFDPIMEKSQQQTEVYNKKIIAGETPLPFTIRPILGPNLPNSNPQLTGQQAKSLTAKLQSFLSPTGTDTFRNTNTRVNIATKQASGTSFSIGQLPITSRSINNSQAQLGQTEYTLDRTKQTNNQSYIDPRVFVNGVLVNLNNTQLDFNFLKQELTGRGTNQITQRVEDRTRLVSTAGIQHAFIKLDEKNIPKLIIKTNLAILLDANANNNLQFGFLAEGSILAKLSPSSSLAGIARYSTIPDVANPNKISGNYNWQINKELGLSLSGTHYLDNGINKRFFNDINTNTYQAQLIYKPNLNLSASLGIGSEGLSAGISTTLFNRLTTSASYQKNATNNIVNLGLGFKTGGDGKIEIIYRNENGSNPSQSSLIQFSNSWGN